jgi:striatin 1/3/4
MNLDVDELKAESAECVSCLNEDKSQSSSCCPTSVDFIKNDKTKIITSFGWSHHALYDLETSKCILKLDYSDGGLSAYCYKVLSHPTLTNVNSSLVISAHEDKTIRFFDLNSGKSVYHMVAHQDACTDIAIDPTCFYLLSASHDCSLRLWNLDNKNCIQEMTSHRKKYDESINCIAFHPTKPFIASGGADAVVKIYI